VIFVVGNSLYLHVFWHGVSLAIRGICVAKIHPGLGLPMPNEFQSPPYPRSQAHFGMGVSLAIGGV